MTLEFSAVTENRSYPIMLPEMYVDLENPKSAEPILHLIFPEWSDKTASSTETIIIEQLTGGITNKLFQATHTPSGTKVLIRSYGKGTSAIIDRDREVSTHMHLHSKGLAPPLYARFGNGLVYSYMPGKAVNYQHLSDPEVSDAVARRIAEWHTLLDPTEIESFILSQRKSRGDSNTQFSRNIWELLEAWIETMPENVIKAYSREDLRKELAWVRKTIGSSGGQSVVAHCDLLAGNVIVPEDFEPSSSSSAKSASSEESSNGSTLTAASTATTSGVDVNFIDYEYAMLAPRAFDLANHFMEWQGFDCVTELIPTPSLENPVLRQWAASYLSFTASSKSSPKEIDTLLTEVLTYWGIPGLYWGIWASIQSIISDIDFDYASYANSRLEEYTNWKTKFQASESLPAS